MLSGRRGAHADDVGDDRSDDDDNDDVDDGGDSAGDAPVAAFSPTADRKRKKPAETSKATKVRATETRTATPSQPAVTASGSRTITEFLALRVDDRLALTTSNSRRNFSTRCDTSAGLATLSLDPMRQRQRHAQRLDTGWLRPAGEVLALRTDGVGVRVAGDVGIRPSVGSGELSGWGYERVGVAVRSSRL